MVVPTNDVGFALDMIHVLNEIGGPVAFWARDWQVQQLRNDEASPIRRPEELSDAKVAHFIRRCTDLAQTTEAEINTSAHHLNLERTMQLSILLGQLDLEHNAITTSANAFAPEMELVVSAATSQSPRPRRWRIGNDLHAATRSLQLARRTRVLRQMATIASAMLTESDVQVDIGALFALEALAIRGTFTTPHDFRYIRRLAAKMNAKDLSVPGPDGVAHILQVFVQRWMERLVLLDGALPNQSTTRTIIATQALLAHRSTIGWAERNVLRRHLPRLSLSRDEIVAGASDSLRNDVTAWLDVLSIPQPTNRSLAEEGNVAPFTSSSLSRYPILRGSDGYLLALAHRISSELSVMNDTAWGGQYGESYHRARAETVEELALESIAALADGAQAIRQATYQSADFAVHGEVDGVVVWQDICIVLEGKGAFLSNAARRGSGEAAIGDMRDTVGHGYYQAARLIRIIANDGGATLDGSHGRKLHLDGRALRRAYVVVPTADDYGTASIRLGHLWDSRVLPEFAVPLIISIQELLKLTELLGSFPNLVAYLDFREEILLNRWIEMVDEMELLGAFIGGIDVVGECTVDLRAKGFTDDFKSRYSHHRVCPAPVQEQRHLEPWYVRKYGKTLEGDPSIASPQRHSDVSAEQIRRMWRHNEDLQAYTAAIAIAPDVMTAIIRTAPPPPSRRPLVRSHHNVTAVIFGARTGLARAVRDPAVRTAVNSSRYAIFVEFDRQARLSHVERGPRHTCHRTPQVNFATRSIVPIHDSWFASFERRRRKTFDHALATALESEGIPHDLAIGVSRANVAAQVRALAQQGVSIAKAAAFWLGPVRTAATALNIAPDIFPLSPHDLSQVVTLIEARVLPTQHVPALMVAMISTGEPAERAASTHDLLETHNDREVHDAVLVVIAAHADAVAKVRAGNSKVLDFLIGQVLRRLDRRPNVERVRSLLTGEIEHLNGD